MKCTIPEISWHNRDPVLSVDVQPISNNDYYRLASGGTDSHVLIWHLRILKSGATSVEPVSDLTRHQRAVNVVRWSPSGQYLASGDDDSNIIVWHQKADELSSMLDGETQDKEKWSVLKVLRGHKEDVYDICWSPNSNKLVSGSVDNTAIIWDLIKGNNDNILTDHKGFVQGVCWDPQGQYIATLSSDRMMRVFNETGKQVKCRTSKGCLALPENHALHGQVLRYYHDDTLKSFFRRLCFSPDGNLLITPAGCLDSGQPNKPLYTTYIYVTNYFSQPAAILPSPSQYTIAIRCCPTLFELRTDGPDSTFTLPYRMVIAVATRSSVILYDTQQMTPFAVISNIHYTRLTDLTWSQDGRILAISSTDGFCSLVTFEPNELGKEYVKEESDEENLEQSVCEENLDTSVPDEKQEEKKEKKPTFLKQWALKKTNLENSIKTDEKQTVNGSNNETEVIICDTPTKNENANQSLMSNNSTPAKPIAVRRKPREQIDTPSKNKVINQNTVSTDSVKVATPVKPIAVRRKPHSDQMNITTFLKSSSEPPAKKPTLALEEKNFFVAKKTTTEDYKVIDTIVISDDSIAQDAWDSNAEMEVNQAEIFVIEDSQDMKLVLEDSTCGHSIVIKEQDNVTKDDKVVKKNTVEDESKEICEAMKCDENIPEEDERNSKEENCSEESSKQEINSKTDCVKQICNEINEMHCETETESKSQEKTNVKLDTDKANSKVETDEEGSTVENEVKNLINDLHVQPASLRIAAISAETSSKRKKVPFITISSPKSKKKDG